MKELKINEKCSGCGLCIISAPSYFCELSDGNAKVVKFLVEKSDENQIVGIVEKCPENAIVVTEKKDFFGNKKEVIEQAIKQIQKYNDEFKIERVTDEGYEFWNREDGIYFYTQDEWPPAYNSESAAKAAARDRFREQCYSEQAYRPKLKEIFVNYKVNNSNFALE